MWSSSFVLRAATAYISFSQYVLQAAAQAWTPGPSCGSGGTYTDPYGGVWSVTCNADNTGAIYTTGNTNGQGIYACFKGCTHRPECNGFSFAATKTQTSATVGAGVCYYRSSIGSYYSNTTYYAAANLVSYAPTQACNGYNGTTFVDSTNTAWQISCGKDVIAAGGSPAQANVQNMQQCMTACNNNAANGTCSGFTYTYGGSEPTDTDTTTLDGMCYFKSGTIQLQNEASGAHVGVAVRVGAIGAAPTASSATLNQGPPPTQAAQAAGAGAGTSSSTSTSSSATANPAPVAPTTTTTTTSSSSSTSAAVGGATNVAQAGGTGSGSTGGSSGSSATQWTPAAACGSGGQYTDNYGAIWNVNCGQDNTGAIYDQANTNGQGIYACFKACDERPICTGFSFSGSVSGTTIGSGVCYFRSTSGTYYTNSTYYAAANLVKASTQLPCTAYNGTTYQDSNGVIWNVNCGFDIQAQGSSNTPIKYVHDMRGCMTNCNTTTDCSGFSYGYSGDEPTDSDTTTLKGICYFKKGTYQLIGNGQNNVAMAVSVGTAAAAAPTTSFASSSASMSQGVANTAAAGGGGAITGSASTTTTTTTTSSSTASSPTLACTGTPSPAAISTLSCSGANQGVGLIGQFADGCNTTYTVYCGNNTNPGAASQASASSILDCMQKCDGVSGCVAATFDGNLCYFKTAFSGVTTTTNPSLAALVRYIPPNPRYSAPATAGGTNTSTGCGQPLPAGIQPNGASTTQYFLSPSDGLLRNYTIHIPQYYNSSAASPLIFAFHGKGESGSQMETECGLSDPTVNPYGIMVYPNGWGGGWASNPNWQGSYSGTFAYVDDIGFIKALIANLTASYCIDTGRIFATGHSNGAGFANVIACDPVLSQTFAAIAPNSAAVYTNNTDTNYPTLNNALYDTIEPVNTVPQAVCSPSRNIPFFETHGTNDGQIYYPGGSRTHKIWPSIPHFMNEWALREGFQSTKNYTTSVAYNATLFQWGGETGNLGIIQHLRLDNWIHAWPTVGGGAPVTLGPMVMDFFYKWSDPNRQAQYVPVSSSSSSMSSSSTSTSMSSSSSVMPITTTTTSSSSL